MANTYLSWTPSGAGSTTKWTTSFWVKRGTLGSEQELVANWSSGTDNTTVRFLSGDTLDIVDYQSSSVVMKRVTNRVFRDTSAWYHIVVNIDTDEATANDRTKLYINGVQETSFSTTTNYSLGQAHKWNTTYVHNVGQNGGGSGYFNGSISHLHMIDGTAYDASAFGEYDANGVWKIKTSPSVTYGTNGFFILKNGNSVTDQSGQGNNFTVAGGTLTNTEDSPSNVFATLNPLAPIGGGSPSTLPTFSKGNLEVTVGDGTARFATATIATAIPYYFEIKITAISASDSGQRIGVQDEGGISSTTSWYSQYFANGDIIASGESTVNVASWGVNDIIGVAVDLATDNSVKFYKNGTLQTTVAVGASYQDLRTTPLIRIINATNTFQCNFGNGYFGTTAVSSAGTNASGNGIFEFDVPTGYTALSTKGLNL